MTSLEAVSCHQPGPRVAVAGHLRAMGMADRRADMYERYFGFAEVRLDPKATLADHLAAAILALPDLEAQRSRIRYVIHARTMAVAAPHPVNPLLQACRRTGLEHAETFSLTQHACAAGLLGVEVAGRLLEADGDPDARALLLAGEKAFTAAGQLIDSTAVMGETASAVLISAGGSHDRVLGYATIARGEFASGAWMEPETAAVFQQEYPGALADVITAAVASAGLDLGDIAVILPHNVNQLSWLRVLQRLGLKGTSRLYLDNLATHGHCFGADPFLNLRSAERSGRIRRGDRYVMTSVGLGATFSAMVFEH